MEKLIQRRVLLFYTLFSVISAVILAAGRTWLMLNCFDESALMYDSGAVAPAYFRGLTAAVCIFLGTAFFVFRRQKTSGAGFRNVSLATVFTASLCCFMLFAYLFVSVWEMVQNGFSDFAVFFDLGAQLNERTRMIFILISLVFMIPTAVYFFRVASVNNHVGSGFALLSMSSIVCIATLLTSVYLDISVSFNSPNKILSQLCLIGMMLYMVYETRLNMGIARLRLYFPIAMITTVLCLVYSVSNLIVTFFSYISAKNDTLFDVLILTFGVYVVSRCASFLRKAEPEEQTEITE